MLPHIHQLEQVLFCSYLPPYIPCVFSGRVVLGIVAYSALTFTFLSLLLQMSCNLFSKLFSFKTRVFSAVKGVKWFLKTRIAKKKLEKKPKHLGEFRHCGKNNYIDSL